MEIPKNTLLVTFLAVIAFSLIISIAPQSNNSSPSGAAITSNQSWDEFLDYYDNLTDIDPLFGNQTPINITSPEDNTTLNKTPPTSNNTTNTTAPVTNTTNTTTPVLINTTTELGLNTSEDIFQGTATSCDNYISTCKTSGWVAGQSYCLTSDIDTFYTPYCMSGITVNNIVIDCQGHSITASPGSSAGIYIIRGSPTTTGITIKNCILTDFFPNAIYINNGGGNTISNVTVTSSYRAFSISSNDNLIINNTLLGNYVYAMSVGGTGNRLINNTADRYDTGCTAPLAANSGNVGPDHRPFLLVNESNQVIRDGVYSHIMVCNVNNITIDNVSNHNKSATDYVLGGIDVKESNDVRIYNSNMSYVRNTGFNLYKADNITFINNTANHNARHNGPLTYEGRGVYALDVSNIYFLNNTLSYNDIGITRHTSYAYENITLINNTAINNSWTDYFYYFSGKPCDIINNDSYGNVGGTSGLPYPILLNTKNKELRDAEYAGIYACNVNNTVFDNITINNQMNPTDNWGSNGLIISRSDNVTLSNINVSYVYDGVELYDVNNSTLVNSSLTNSSYTAEIYVYGSDNIIRNNFRHDGESGDGFVLYGNRNIVDENTAIFDEYDGQIGFDLEGNNNNFTNNTVVGADYGFYMYDDMSDNLVANNSFLLSKSYGIYMGDTLTGNEFHNNFFYNDVNTLFEQVVNYAAIPWNNDWNDSVGGNYWGLPSGLGISQTCPDVGSDGICDKQYDVLTNTNCTQGVNCPSNTDYLPLSTHPFIQYFIAPGVDLVFPNVIYETGGVIVYPARQNQTFEVTLNITCRGQDCGDISVGLGYNTTALISTTPGATPFSTTSPNPQIVTLNENEYQSVTFWVNATGDLYTGWELIANVSRVNKLHVLIRNDTETFFVNILPQIPSPDLVIRSWDLRNLLAGENATVTENYYQIITHNTSYILPTALIGGTSLGDEDQMFTSQAAACATDDDCASYHECINGACQGRFMDSIGYRPGQPISITKTKSGVQLVESVTTEEILNGSCHTMCYANCVTVETQECVTKCTARCSNGMCREYTDFCGSGGEIVEICQNILSGGGPLLRCDDEVLGSYTQNCNTDCYDQCEESYNSTTSTSYYNESVVFQIDEEIDLRYNTTTNCSGGIVPGYRNYLQGAGTAGLTIITPDPGAYDICSNVSGILGTLIVGDFPENGSGHFSGVPNYIELEESQNATFKVNFTVNGTNQPIYFNLSLERWFDNNHTEPMPVPPWMNLTVNGTTITGITVPINSTVTINITITTPWIVNHTYCYNNILLTANSSIFMVEQPTNVCLNRTDENIYGNFSLTGIAGIGNPADVNFQSRPIFPEGRTSTLVLDGYYDLLENLTIKNSTNKDISYEYLGFSTQSLDKIGINNTGGRVILRGDVEGLEISSTTGLSSMNITVSNPHRRILMENTTFYNVTLPQITSITYTPEGGSGNLISSSNWNFNPSTDTLVIDQQLQYNYATSSNLFTLGSGSSNMSIDIKYPMEFAAYENVTEIRYLVDDQSGNCWYTLDNGATYSSTVSAGTNFTSLIIPEGHYNLTIYCTDSSLNLASNSREFIVGDYNWATEMNKMVASDAQADAYFGAGVRSISLSGDYALIAAPGEYYEGADTGAAYLFKKNPTTGEFEEVNKIGPSDLQTDDIFGSSASISGDYAIVGSMWDDDEGSSAGAAYLYEKNSTGEFEQIQKITASDAEASDFFGRSVGISGDYAIVGAYFGDSGAITSGAAYIFKKNESGLFEEVNKIVPSDAEGQDYFGYSVAISEDYAIVGAMLEDTGGDRAGAAYIFKKNPTTGQFGEVNKIIASDAEANDEFGLPVSISGDYAVIGVYKEDTGGSAAGAAYIFKKNSSGEFEQLQKIQASDRAAGANFGYSASISGDYVVVAAERDAEGGDNAGAAYIFKKNSSGLFEEFKKVIPSGTRNYLYFGRSSAISGNYALVGAPEDATGGFSAGAVYSYRLHEDHTPPHLTWNWTEINTTTNFNQTFICINSSELISCTLNFNGTPYINDTDATNVCWYLNGLSDGNYSNVYATCADLPGNPINTSTAWLDVLFTGPSVNIDIITPIVDITVAQNKSFYVRVGVDCYNTNCGNLEVTLDPHRSIFFNNTNVTVGGGEEDCITPNVCLTRNLSGCCPLYNTVYDSGPDKWACDSPKPTGTLWAIGNCDLPNLSFSSFIGENFTDCAPPDVVGLDACLYLTLDDKYVDIKFLSWGERGAGGFSYVRSSPGKGGAVSTTFGDTPFYTTSANPQTFSLNSGETNITTFLVNATGSINTTWDFYALLEGKYDLEGVSNNFNVTISDTSVCYCGDDVCNCGEDEDSCPYDCTDTIIIKRGCSKDWMCGSWGDCINGTQTRSCNCGCANDNDCEGNHDTSRSCTINTTIECNTSLDCPGDEICINGTCKPPINCTLTGDSCTTAQGCPGLTDTNCNCLDTPTDNCPPECTLDTDCPGDEICTNGTCNPQVECTLDSQCGDGNDCTSDTCVNGICQNLDETGTSCNDGNPCTENDVCQSGTCSPGPGICECETDTICNDNNPCTSEVCSNNECEYTLLSGTSCDDGDPCTSGDVCSAGVCTPGEGVCDCETDLDCSVEDPCIFGECVNNLCQYEATTGNSCNDLNPCTSGDICSVGICVPGEGVCECQTDNECDDDDICTEESCVNNICEYDLVTVGNCRDPLGNLRVGTQKSGPIEKVLSQSPEYPIFEKTQKPTGDGMPPAGQIIESKQDSGFIGFISENALGFTLLLFAALGFIFFILWKKKKEKLVEEL